MQPRSIIRQADNGSNCLNSRELLEFREESRVSLDESLDEVEEAGERVGGTELLLLSVSGWAVELSDRFFEE